LAKTEEERAAIERRYSAEGAREKGENDLSRIQAEREKLKKDIETWRESISNYEADNKSLDKEWSAASKTFAKASKRANSASWYWQFGLDDDIELQSRAGDAMSDITESRLSNLDNIKQLKTQIDNALKQLSRLKIDEETVKTTMKADAMKARTAESDAAKASADAKKKADEEAKSKADAELKAKKEAEEKAAAMHDKAMRKAAEDEAKAIKDARIKADKEVMAERKRRLTELTTMESDAAKRLAAAQSKVAEAWAWYRDKDKMAAQLKEEKAEAEAQKQFEKDFEDLKWRRDWRTAKDLSVDQEAVRRVALAKEEETAAQKALAETAKSTAQAAASLAEIEKVITAEG
jgi:colicin import membrane protein